MMRKVLFVGLGTISLGCGIVGIVVPGLPTTPFVLLAAWFYVRSSERLHQKLIGNPFFGRYIANYERGLSRKSKYRIFILMWMMIILSTSLFIYSWPVRLVVVAAGVIGTGVVWRIKEPQ
ncbi:YbaN family protein [Alistipes sp. ZOR0009]|jgi:uncharacterized membrane protein YbaN (DUF454 family)|uniref:YbaN family protein n=1 Tax=Alistipes sp. ZOR0009 TaxID=1339253 RepID=UPI00068FD382|nr:YbaN family protein [Alistipes sp. ZOR0009]